MVHEFNQSRIRFSFGSNVTATNVAAHTPQTIAAVLINSRERDDRHQEAIREQFAALDSAGANKAAGVSAQGLETRNPLVDSHRDILPT